MHTPKTILVGLELSLGGHALGDGSQRALDQALAVATRSGAKVTLVHSTHADEHYDAPAGERVYRRRDGVSPEGQAALDAGLATLEKAGVEAALELTAERAWLALTKMASRAGADLVIVGKREHTDFDFDDRRLGAVATKLLRKCPCPVWTVGADGRPEVRSIVAATDLTKSVGPRIVEIAAGLAKSFEADLTLLHACQMSMLDAVWQDRRGLDAALTKAQAEAEKALEAIGKEVPGAKVMVVRGAPTRAIVEATRSQKPDLLVMGTVSRTGVRGVLVGNTAERIFSLVDVPLLTVKPEGFAAPID